MRLLGPRTQGISTAALLSGGLSIALGLLVMAGWYSGNELLIRFHPLLDPMQLNTALGLMLGGLSLVAASTGRKWPTALPAALAALLGGLTLIEHVMDADLGIDQLLLRAFPTASSLRPGRIPLHASLALLLVGAALLLYALRARLHRPSAWMALLATLSLGFGLLPILGYLSGLATTNNLPAYTRGSAHAALGISVLSLGLLERARAMARAETDATPSPWLPVCLGTGTTIAALMLWNALQMYETEQVTRGVQLQARNLRGEITTGLSDELATLQRFAARVGESDQQPNQSWRMAARFLTEQSRYIALAWVSPDRRVRQVVPLQGNQSFIGADLAAVAPQRAALDQAALTGDTALSPAFRLNGRYALFGYVPMFQDQRLSGFVAAAFDLPYLIEHLLRRELGQGYGLAVYGDQGLLFSSNGPPPDTLSVQLVPLDAYGLNWRLAVWPLPWLRDSQDTLLPEAVLLAGLMLSLLLGYALRAKQLLEHSSERIRRFNAELEQRVAQRTAQLATSNRELEQEVAERERVAKELAFLAKYDPLTHLPNRVMFDEHLHQAIARAGRDGTQLAVFFLDLDNFKDINDSLGHQTGDELLRQFAQRIRATLREIDVIARLGGDEFAILAEELPRGQDAGAVAEKILEAMNRSFALAGNTVLISTSIGIATYPEAGHDAETLVKNADAAMYQAKNEGRNTFAMYSTRLQELALRRLDLRRKLHEALDRDEFLVYYQPKIRLSDNRIVGAEALLRWRHDSRLVSPAEFIPLTEETGLIVPIGTLVLRKTCEDLLRWQRLGLQLPELSVNVSAKQFRNNRLLEDIHAYVEPNPALAPHLELELTERVFIEDSEAHRWLLRQVASMGIRISIDDFGTGCSSFSYFRNFPIHAVKIDQSFIQNVCDNSHDAKITETVLDLAQNFQIKVVAEGVESAEQLAFLRERQCDQAQGFYISRPVTSEMFQQLWQRQGISGRALH